MISTVTVVVVVTIVKCCRKRCRHQSRVPHKLVVVLDVANLLFGETRGVRVFAFDRTYDATVITSLIVPPLDDMPRTRAAVWLSLVRKRGCPTNSPLWIFVATCIFVVHAHTLVNTNQRTSMSPLWNSGERLRKDVGLLFLCWAQCHKQDRFVLCKNVV